MVLHPDRAVALSQEEHAGADLALGDDAVFRHVEVNLDVVDEEVNEVLTATEEIIGGNGVEENVLGDFVPETGRDHLQEVIQFPLAVHVILSLKHEVDDLVLDGGGQLYVDHGGVGHVDFVLELELLAAD